jgi:chloramphenicol O-acetyltransferase type A
LELQQKAKELKVSFFTYYLHKTLIAVNKIKNFRYRILNDQVFVFDQIDASATVMREDNTFGFSLIKFDSDLVVFAQNTANEIARVQNTTGLFTRDFEENLIHFSTIPWVNFSSLSHARIYTFPDSCPKITFGKMIEESGKKTMSMSIHVHHALVDGYHVGQFVEVFEKLMNE